MEDRELLEMAAKAAGMKLKFRALTNMPGCAESVFSVDSRGITEPWNPLERDGDALRLAAQLGIGLEIKDQEETLTAWWNSGTLGVKQSQDIGTLAAMRRAITRAAADIGSTF